MHTLTSPIAALEDFNTRLLMTVHGIGVAELERGSTSVLSLVREIVRAEIRALGELVDDAATFDSATEELRALRKMTLRRVEAQSEPNHAIDTLVAFQEKQLAAIERV